MNIWTPKKKSGVEQIGARALGSATNEASDEKYDVTAGNNYRDARGQLDLSASWLVRDNVTIAASITNLLDEPSSFTSELGGIWKYSEADRRVAIGVRARY